MEKGGGRQELPSCPSIHFLWTLQSKMDSIPLSLGKVLAVSHFWLHIEKTVWNPQSKY